MTLKFETMASGLGFVEGPAILKDGSLLFVQIDRQLLSMLSPNGNVETVAHLPGGPNGVANGPDGAAYVCNNGGAYSFMKITLEGHKLNVPNPAGPGADYKGGSIQRVDLSSGTVTTLYDSCDDQPLPAPDDIVFDKHGGFWFTGTGTQTPTEISKGGVFYAATDGTKIEKVADIPTANGIGLSPDGKTLYVADTLWGRLWSLDIIAPGKVKPGALPGMPGNVVQTLPGYQWVDSLKVEADGRICVGTLLNGGITVFQTNGEITHHPVPDMFTTNLCFAGNDMQDVYLTASSTGCIYKTRWPRPGLKLNY